MSQDIVDAEVTPVKAPTFDELKSQYLTLCSQVGEKNLQIALMTEECAEMGERLKKIARELFPMVQQQQQQVKEQVDGQG